MKVICKNAKVTQRYVSPRGMITYPIIECKSDCPNCGSYNVIANDNPLTGNGEGKCTDCGAHWIAIEGEDNKEGEK